MVMKRMPDGTELNMTQEEFAFLMREMGEELGWKAAPKPAEAPTQAEVVRAFLDSQPSPEVTETENESAVIPSTEQTPPMARGFNLYLPCTKFERDALIIMRTRPDYEWTSNEVADQVNATGKYRERLMNAVSQMARQNRGVVRVINNLHYRLDQYGREAILYVCARPTFHWAAMRHAGDNGIEYKMTSVLRRQLIEVVR